MPTDWELPKEIFDLNLRKSENPTVNLCDAIVRKVNILNENFRGKRKPEYMRYQFTPSTMSKENCPPQKMTVYENQLTHNFARSASVPTLNVKRHSEVDYPIKREKPRQQNRVFSQAFVPRSSTNMVDHVKLFDDMKIEDYLDKVEKVS